MKQFLIASCLLLGGMLYAEEYTLRTSLNKPDGFYEKGEIVKITAELLVDGKPATDKTFRYILYNDSAPNAPLQTATVSGAKPLELECSLPHPGRVRFEARAYEADEKTEFKQKNRPVTGYIAAMIAPKELKLSFAEPADFDAFWNAQKAELAKVPLKVLKSAPSAKQKEGFVAESLEIACAGNRPVCGQFVLPANTAPKTLPAVLYVHGAGHKSANPRFVSGAMTFEINAHGIANDQPNDYYNDLFAGELKNYNTQGYQSRETFYFRNMYLRLMRALEYLKSRPEWDGKNLVVNGTSMGGAQAIAAAGLDGDVTLCISNDAALSDLRGGLDTPIRSSGWPRNLVSPDHPEAKETAQYYDSIYFAKRIRCETHFTISFMDNTCPPTGVYMAYSAIPGENKSLVTDTRAHHCGTMRKNKGEERLKELAKEADLRKK